jgi:hypothetical protein
MRLKFTVPTISLYMFGRDTVRIAEVRQVYADRASGQRDLDLRVSLRSVHVNKVRLTAFIAAAGLCRDRCSLGPVPLAAF